jgi:hypothetical protein
MVQTFLYRTKTSNINYHHTIYSADIKSSVEKWLNRIEDLKDEVYSFDKIQVENIWTQFLNNQFQIHFDKEPYFLTYKVGDRIQVVNIDKVKKGDPDFVAKLTYLTTEEGGRDGYAASGYRPYVKFDGRKEITSGEQLFVDKDKVLPGETVTAEIRMLSPNFFDKYLFVGQHFEIGEGSKVVGHGEVLEIINPSLRQASR